MKTTEEVVNLLKQTNLSNYKISKDTGISDETINNYRTGKTKPRGANLKLLSKYLDSQRAISYDNNMVAGRDIHHINTSVEKVLECLNAQQAMTAEALAQNSKLIQIIDRLTNN
ncbi:MAG: helix-turn-helix domain-containing protein [Bacteroidales bacterium]|nr:helix-turn-helix domain-containing protein [Bacteroidales bacterium]